jgi:riboflavin kinase/FMN adenylyltransferase
MRIVRGLAGVDAGTYVVLTVGVFDGVHRGHQQLIEQVRQRAQALDCVSAVITFDPHPRAVLTPGNPVPYLTTLDAKIVLLDRAGVELLIIITFTREMADMPAATFMQLICDYLSIKELMVGPDFALGCQREGTLPLLEQVGEQLGFGVRSVMPLLVDGHMVSSTRIRKALAQGDVREAARLLGRPYTLYGEVVLGARRGQDLGFPTANLSRNDSGVALGRGQVLPDDGVYATYALLGDEHLPSVSNVGVRPSFDNGERLVEAHILDFDRDIYGEALGVEFIERLRDEKRYENIDQLIAQMQRDAAQARSLLMDA